MPREEAGNLNLNATTIEGGWALAYRKYKEVYVEEEDLARQAKAKIWAA